MKSGKLDLVRVSGEFELSEFEISGFYSTNKGKKKPVKLIVQTSFAEKNYTRRERDLPKHLFFIFQVCDVI